MKLGITRREWTLVLGANLAILLIAYAIALACTLSGSDFFLLMPSTEAIIISAIAYGCGLALAFRLGWELHDLRLFRKAMR